MEETTTDIECCTSRLEGRRDGKRVLMYRFCHGDLENRKRVETC